MRVSDKGAEEDVVVVFTIAEPSRDCCVLLGIWFCMCRLGDSCLSCCAVIM